MRKNSARVEFGDFQTPLALAQAVCKLVARMSSPMQGASPSRSSAEDSLPCEGRPLVRERCGPNAVPATVVEPTCGSGSFLEAAASAFPAATLYGCDCNSAYVNSARARLPSGRDWRVETADFYSHDWRRELSKFSTPLLVVGNPPWVTSSTVGALRGRNLPTKSNADKLPGIQAITGGANFDVSEWMIRQYFGWLEGHSGTIAVLCKTSVARKVLFHAWSNQIGVEHAAIYRIDSARAFGVSVDACLLYIRLAAGAECTRCDVYEDLGAVMPKGTIGFIDGMLVSNADTYERLAHLRTESGGAWRSGLKHDCKRVFEFSPVGDDLINGFGERVSIEAEVVFPLLKSSDVANGRTPRKRVLAPHRSMQESPLVLQRRAPKAWRYLLDHRSVIESRRSSIYRKRPPFSIFGIGPYSFSPWKVAIAGLYKDLRFVKVGAPAGKPLLLDDTCYFLPCETEAQCDLAIDLLASAPAIDFLSALAFRDAKRPITAKLLNSLDLVALAKQIGTPEDKLGHLPSTPSAHQPALF